MNCDLCDVYRDDLTVIKAQRLLTSIDDEQITSSVEYMSSDLDS